MVEYKTAEEAAAAQEKLLEDYKNDVHVRVLWVIGDRLTPPYLRENMAEVRALSEENRAALPPNTPKTLDDFEALENKRLALLEKGPSGDAPEKDRAYAISTLVGVGPMDQLFAAIKEGVSVVQEWWQKQRPESPSNESAQAEPDRLAPTAKGQKTGEIATQYNKATDNNPDDHQYRTFGGRVDLSELNSQKQTPEPSGPSATQIIAARFGAFSP